VAPGLAGSEGMNITVTKTGLPSTPKELAPFIAVGTAAVNAARQVLKSGKLSKEQFQSVLVKAQEQGELVIHAKAELGRVIVETPNDSAHKKSDVPLGNTASKKAAYTDLGITHKQAANYQTIAKNPEAVEKAKAIAKDNNDIPTESLVLQVIKTEQTEKKRADVKESLESISAQKAKAIKGVYDVIVIDPPWEMEKIERDERPRQAGFDYPTMAEGELAQLKIPAADDCHIFLWATHKHLPMALRLLEKWGFKYVCTFVWHKNGGFQPFGLPQYNCEFCLYTDLIVLELKAVRIACRIRKDKYREKYGHEFTIRSFRKSGNKTELAKIVEGWGDYIFYGFADDEGLTQWFIGDLKAFRLWFTSEAIKNGVRPGMEKSNGDESSDFLAFEKDAIPNFIISESKNYDFTGIPF
jgi:hypothetical protein